MQLMPRVGKFYGPIELEPVSMEACQSAMGAYMWVMDTVLVLFSAIRVVPNCLPSVLSKNLCG